ncbi:MAG: beta-1,6-N-acetylglucosaminyltransferase, partial [Oscillospiraceae bacterium]
MNNKHAYLIMSHNEFDILIELLKDIDDNRNDIYLHIDKKIKNYPKDKLCAAVKNSNLFFIPSMKVNWGGYSQIECEMLLMKMACNKGNYDYYHLLTGVTFPIKNQDEIHKFFQDNNGMEFVGFDKNKDYSHRLIYVHLF